MWKRYQGGGSWSYTNPSTINPLTNLQTEISQEDEKWLELMGVDSFTLHCTNIRNLIVSIMYCINKPALLQKIQEHVLLESMKKEITDGKDVPQDVIDEFLDFMNMVKNKQ